MEHSHGLEGEQAHTISVGRLNQNLPLPKRQDQNLEFQMQIDVSLLPQPELEKPGSGGRLLTRPVHMQRK